MQEKEITVTNPKGIHARPSAMLAQAATDFQSTIILINGEKRANTRSVMEIMMLGATYGSNLTIQTAGADEDNAMERIVDIFNLTFGDD
jgi:phosphotransferase system HPr (HPr) family protein